ncbi:MAG: hypothetical protein M0C28_23750 [Candidatus Moduliflexus flocculans]|nr:hypothetical protein [Candidatus Moduliflexus flocculans]
MAPVLGKDQTVVSLTKGFDKRTHDADEPGHGGGLPSSMPGPAWPSFPGRASPARSRPAIPRPWSSPSREPAAARDVQHAHLEREHPGLHLDAMSPGSRWPGALKNVVAIAAGIADAMEFGLNTRSALITRGLVEITNLGLALGARRETFSGPGRDGRPHPDLHRRAQPQPPRRPGARPGPEAGRDPGRDADGRGGRPHDRGRPAHLPGPRRGDAHLRTDLPGPLPRQGAARRPWPS